MNKINTPVFEGKPFTVDQFLTLLENYDAAGSIPKSVTINKTQLDYLKLECKQFQLTKGTQKDEPYKLLGMNLDVIYHPNTNLSPK